MTQSTSHPAGGVPPAHLPIPDSALRRVHTALTHLKSHSGGPTIPPGELVQPLLDLWAAANEVHPWVALPVQHFLTGLAAERPVPASEVHSLAEDVSVLLLEVRSLATHDPGVGVPAAP